MTDWHRKLVFILFCLISLCNYGQESPGDFDGHKWEAPYHLPIPKDWTIERFQIPISFALQIPYKGVEDIRFSPGWGKATSDEYWTYAFLWYIDTPSKTGVKIIAQNLKTYYEGLIASNTDSVWKATEKQTPVTTSFRKIPTFNGDLETYEGTIKMKDYMQRKSIILNCTVHIKDCRDSKKTILFFEISPKPFTHGNWNKLNQLWTDFKCQKDDAGK